MPLPPKLKMEIVDIPHTSLRLQILKRQRFPKDDRSFISSDQGLRRVQDPRTSRLPCLRAARPRGHRCERRPLALGRHLSLRRRDSGSEVVMM